MARRTDDGTATMLGVIFLIWLVQQRSGSGTKLFGGKGRKGIEPSPRTKPLTPPKSKGPKGPPVIDVPYDKPRKASTLATPARPPGTVSASPELESRHGRTPEGYNPSQAQAQAQGIAAHLTTKGPKAYDRAKLKRWQTLAAVRADGTYGGSTRGALVHYGAKDPPRPFVAPFATLPYHQPDR